MRRLLLPSCVAVVILGIAAFAQITPETAVAVRGASNPFPAVWTAQSASEVASQASAVTAALRLREATERWTAVATWNAAVEANALAERQRQRVAEQRVAPRPRPTSPARPPARSEPGTGRCGGDLPPCSVMMCESGGSLTAENPHSTASGKWQILQTTSDGYARSAGRPDLIGVPASQWSEADQDDAARAIYRGGSGRGAWVC